MPGNMKPLKLMSRARSQTMDRDQSSLANFTRGIGPKSYDGVEEMVSNCVYSKFNLKTGECAAWSQSFLGIPGTGIIGGVVGNVSVDGFIATP